jgi:drug/metabolite transporter (DMT)-like permease
MRTLAFTLVFISCFLHAWWNLVYKRAGGSQIIMGWSKIAEVLIFLPAFLLMLHWHPISLAALAPFAVVGAVLTGANYVLLGRAYAAGNLSVAYPVSRAGILFFLPVMAYLLSSERISWVGALAVGVVLVGVLLLQFDSSTRWRAFLANVAHPSTVFALLAALAAAAYTLWDRHAVREFPAFMYFYGYTVFLALAYAVWLASRRAEAVASLRANLGAVLQIGMLNIVTYTLVLLALRDSNATYVIAVRQLSIGIGAVLGWRLLNETASLPNQIGVALLIAGCALVSVA